MMKKWRKLLTLFKKSLIKIKKKFSNMRSLKIRHRLELSQTKTKKKKSQFLLTPGMQKRRKKSVSRFFTKEINNPKPFNQLGSSLKIIRSSKTFKMIQSTKILEEISLSTTYLKMRQVLTNLDLIETTLFIQ